MDRAADALPLSLTVKDPSGNEVSAFTSLTGGSASIDANTPTITSISAFPSTGNVGVGETIAVTVVVDDGDTDTGMTSTTASFNGVAGTSFTDNSDGSYTWTYTVVEGHTDRAADSLPVSVILSDPSGNSNSEYTTSPSSALVDANTPTITGASASPSTGSRKVGDTVVVTLTVDDGDTDTGMLAGTSSASTINGVAATGFSDNGDATYSYTYTVSEGHTDRAADSLPVSLTVKDPSGNEVSAYTTSPSASASIDANTPTIQQATVSPSTGSRKVGDTVVVTLTVDDGATDTGMLAGTSVATTMNGVAATDFTDNGDATYSYTCVVWGRARVCVSVSVCAADSAHRWTPTGTRCLRETWTVPLTHCPCR